MKILVLSNFYPPYELGGEALSCKAIVDGLRSRGHIVEVVTSNLGNAHKTEEGIYREFELEMVLAPLRNALRSLIRHWSIIRNDEKVLLKHIKRLHPDIILIFSMWNIPRHVPALAERELNGRVVYRLASYWPTLPSQYTEYWKMPARSLLTKIPKSLLMPIALRVLNNNPLPNLDLMHAICISEAVYDEFLDFGIHLPDARIVHIGIDVDRFNREPSWFRTKSKNVLKLLYLGRISPEKGIHTAIEALGHLLDKYPETTLTIAGPRDDTYKVSLERTINELHISSSVKFRGKVLPEDVPELMQDHNVLIVPSIWPEPFGRVVLEGMAAGLVVVGTGRGGMKTVLRNGVTGLVFPPEDSRSLASQLEKLIIDHSLGSRFVLAAKKEVHDQYGEEKMIDAYERILRNFLSRGNLTQKYDQVESITL